MKVKELIEKLQNMDQEANLVIFQEYGHYGTLDGVYTDEDNDVVISVKVSKNEF